MRRVDLKPTILRTVLAGLSAIAFLSCGSEEPRINVIFLLLDDMGYADTGVYGNTYHRTPNIDKLAADGMRFTDAYAAAPNCSPTRGSILTGRWPARTGCFTGLSARVATP